MTPFKGPRLASQPAKSGDPSFMTNSALGKGAITADSIEQAQMAPTNRRHRAMGAQDDKKSGAFKGYGPTLK